jgi:hypothetical protein
LCWLSASFGSWLLPASLRPAFPGMVGHGCNPNYLGDRGRRITSSRPTLDKGSKTLSQEQKMKAEELGVELKYTYT